VAGTLRPQEASILNRFPAKGRSSSGVVEDLNKEWKPTMRKSCGFRTSEAIEPASCPSLGAIRSFPGLHAHHAAELSSPSAVAWISAETTGCADR
jgi:hypothetical protein